MGFKLPKFWIGLFVLGLLFSGWFAWNGARQAKAQADVTPTVTQTPQRSPTATPTATHTKTPRPTAWVNSGALGLAGFRLTPTAATTGTVAPTYPPGAIVITVPVTQVVTQVVYQNGGVRTVKQTVIVPQPYPVEQTVIVVVTATPTNTITPTMTITPSLTPKHLTVTPSPTATLQSSVTPSPTATATTPPTATPPQAWPAAFRVYLPLVSRSISDPTIPTPDPYPGP